MPLHISSIYAHHQEVKVALHSLCYHHTYRWPSGTQVERGLQSSLNLCTGPNYILMYVCVYSVIQNYGLK